MRLISKNIIFKILALLILLTALAAGCSWFNASAKTDKQLDQAVKYLSENKFEEAVLAYNDVIKIDSKNLQAHKGLSRAYELQGKFTEAEKALQDGLSMVDDKIVLKLCLASLYVDQGKNAAAEKTYTGIIAENRSQIPAYEGLARALMDQGRTDEALKIASQCVLSNSASEKSYNLLAGAYINKKDQKQVLDLLTQSLKINVNQQAAYLLLEVLFNRDWNKMIEFASTLADSDETAGRALKIYAYSKAGQYDKAAEEFPALNDKSARADKARALAAISYLKKGDKNTAKKLIGEIDLKSAKNPFLYADAARYYLEAGDLKQARSTALTGIALDDTCVENYLVLIEAAKKEGQTDAQYYGYLLLVRSTDTAKYLGQNLKTYGIEVKIPANSGKTSAGPAGRKPLTKDDFTLSGIKLDMMKSQVKGILGEPLNDITIGGGFSKLTYKDGLYVEFLNGKVINVWIWCNNLVDYQRRIPTSRGLKSGDDVSRLYELYGEPDKIDNNRNDNSTDKGLSYYDPANKERFFTFGMKGDTVVEIFMAGPLP
jgi:Flp pilus assembly protein TadD